MLARSSSFSRASLERLRHLPLVGASHWKTSFVSFASHLPSTSSPEYLRRKVLVTRSLSCGSATIGGGDGSCGGGGAAALRHLRLHHNELALRRPLPDRACALRRPAVNAGAIVESTGLSGSSIIFCSSACACMVAERRPRPRLEVRRPHDVAQSWSIVSTNKVSVSVAASAPASPTPSARWSRCRTPSRSTVARRPAAAPRWRAARAPRRRHAWARRAPEMDRPEVVVLGSARRKTGGRPSRN